MAIELITSAIYAALSAGAAAGATDTAKKSVADAYSGLKSLITTKFGAHHEVSKAVAELEAKPASEGRKQTLSEELETVRADSDPEIASAAQALLELIRSLPQGDQHIQSVHGTANAVADRRGVASVNISGQIGKNG